MHHARIISVSRPRYFKWLATCIHCTLLSVLEVILFSDYNYIFSRKTFMICEIDLIRLWQASMQQ
jgi:hypothetical protein